MPWERARDIMECVGSAEGSMLYCVLKVAVPQMRGGRRVERGGWVGGIVRVGKCASRGGKELS